MQGEACGSEREDLAKLGAETVEGAEEAARDDAGLSRGGGEGGEAIGVDRGEFVAAVGLVAAVRGLPRSDPGEPSFEPKPV
ncbi:hypothetical protein WME90_46955 [Sorangium sp. So ce375]|uniref:hypothetical protein n=1 Tax=Sorangium sp. So ce375 TaxID=3133306 RepID=UPI003F5C7AB7